MSDFLSDLANIKAQMNKELKQSADEIKQEFLNENKEKKQKRLQKEFVDFMEIKVKNS